ncbi:MAG: class I SAM-dependent methyltransferase [Chromatiales bacterium]|nr:class I SAM-dependent methyltransferase [Chromatiales bacterium]
METQFLNRLTLIAEDSELIEQLEAVASRLKLPVQLLDQVATPSRYQLVQTSQRLALRETGKGAPGPVYVDFVSGKSAHRRQFGGGRGQPLARAVGLKGSELPKVLDATAGLGRDAFVLASLGCEVTLVERSPVTFALLNDGVSRALNDQTVSEIVQRFELICDDARRYLLSLDNESCPDVVYLDPMYPHRDKSALVKKEMRLFRQMVGDDLDSAELLLAARHRARKRVVVKRPAKAEFLGDLKPDAEIKSPNTRYDLYFTHR